jgi:hypothetical protein
LQWQQNIFTFATKTNEAAVYASFSKESKPCMDGENAKDCVMNAAEILCPVKQQPFKCNSLFASMVAKHVNDLAGDTQCQHKSVNILWHT